MIISIVIVERSTPFFVPVTVFPVDGGVLSYDGVRRINACYSFAGLILMILSLKDNKKSAPKPHYHKLLIAFIAILLQRPFSVTSTGRSVFNLSSFMPIITKNEKS